MRPRGEAIRKPRHNIIIRGKGTPGGLAGAYQGEAKAFSRGRAEPAPPRVEDPGYDGLGGSPGTTRRVIFSEGCALRVRDLRLGASRGTS